jgi:hypothetical protein
MAKPLTIAIPHNLGRAEALARIRANEEKAAEQVRPFVSALEHHWEGDELHVAVKALAQSFAGRVNVEDEVVRIEVVLPPMFGWIGGRVRQIVTQHAPRLLTKG